MINIAIIGAGYIAEEHIKTMKATKKFNITGIYSRTFVRAKKISNQYKIRKTYKSLKEIFSKQKPDAIAVFVSAENMYKILAQVMKYKIPIFLEKPAGLTYNETKRLKNLSIKYKTKNMVALNRRFYSIFRKGIDFLKKRGGIKSFLIEGHERFWKIKNTINNKVYKNWIYANGVHTLDLIRFFGGEIKDFKSFSNNHKEYKNFTISLKFQNNVTGTYISNWNSPDGWAVKLFGNDFTVVFKPLEKGFIINKNFKIKEIMPDKNDKKFKTGFYEQLITFYDLVLTGKLKSPGQNLNDLTKTVKIIRSI